MRFWMALLCSILAVLIGSAVQHIFGDGGLGVCASFMLITHEAWAIDEEEP